MHAITVLVAGLLTALLFLSVQISPAVAEARMALECVASMDSACSTMGNPAGESIATENDELVRYAGLFTNTVFNVTGQITIDLTINEDDTLAGNVDFSQYTAGQFVCGSGDFTGIKSGEQIEIQFTSDDASPACGFYRGVSFTIDAALLNNTIIRGSYSTDTGHQGIVELKRISPKVGIYLPLIVP